MFSLHVVEVRTRTDVGASVVVRVHAGGVRVDDQIRHATSPSGDEEIIDLRVVEIGLTPTMLLDHLDTNYGGLITLDGHPPDGLGPSWTLTD